MKMLKNSWPESTLMPDQAEVTIRHSGDETLKGAAFTCTADRLASKLMRFRDSKWADLKIFTISRHVVDQVEKRLNLLAFDWDSHLRWAQESLRQWVVDGIVPDFPPFTAGSPYIVLRPDPSLPKAIADKEARVLAAAAIKASLEILDYINFQNLNLESIEFLLGLSESEATQNLSQIQKVILSCLRFKTDTLEVDKGKWKGWLQPWERAIEWNPWEEFTQIDWFKEPTASKRATLSRSLQNLEDRGLIGRQTGKGTKKRVSQKHTTYVSLTELGYLTAKLTFLPESLNLQESATKHRCPSSQEAAEMLN
jgi:hypothetical protein